MRWDKNHGIEDLIYFVRNIDVTMILTRDFNYGLVFVILLI